tara:strand:+ start:421 stop:1203 length:783 start_codon:yes stop_codon:yes gene_type:complete
MQKLFGYLLTQNLTVVYSPDSTVENRNRTVYSRPLKAYRGISNTLQVHLKDSDQKPVVVTGKTFVFNILNPSTYVVILSKTGTISNANQGKVNFVLTDSDLRNTDANMYTYSIHELKADGTREVVFAGDNYEAGGTIEVIDGVYNEFVPSRELLIINDEANSGGNTVVKYTSSANAFPELNQNKALHTAQYYLNGYTGTITVQGTMDPISGSLDNWVDIKTDTYSTKTGNEYTTFNGVYTAIRFKQSKTAGTLTKVLYRP